jgi:AcrR family transcriptional regulator
LWDLKRRRTTDELVESAIRLFAEVGYDKTTVADIAATAEHSRSTFFRYFGSKEDVLFADVPGHLDELKLAIERNLVTADPWTAVTNALIDLIKRSYLDPEMVRRRLALWQREPALRARWAEHSSQWELTISEVVAQHRHRAAASDPYALAVAVAAIGAFRIAVATTDSEGADFLGRVESVFRVFESGISHQGP